MITFVSWRWTPTRKYRSTFAPETVYALRDAIAKHYAKPHRFVCVTDKPNELPGIETIPLWDDWAHVSSSIGHSYPSCYRRLKLFAPDAGETFGERVVSIDLDTVIVKDITPIFDRTEDFVIWGESDFPHTTPCCGSLWMLKTGTRPQVWTEFRGERSRDEARKARCMGSDQGWIAYILQGRKPAPGNWKEATWTRDHGVYSYRKHIKKLGGHLPKEAKLIAFHGKVDQWSQEAQCLQWVRDNYNVYLPAVRKAV